MPTVFHQGNAETDELLAEVSYLRKRVAELEGGSPGIEEALRKSEERYRAVAETAFAGISVTYGKENIVYANPAFAQMLGWRPSRRESLESNTSQRILPFSTAHRTAPAWGMQPLRDPPLSQGPEQHFRSGVGVALDGPRRQLRGHSRGGSRYLREQASAARVAESEGRLTPNVWRAWSMNGRGSSRLLRRN